MGGEGGRGVSLELELRTPRRWGEGRGGMAVSPPLLAWLPGGFGLCCADLVLLPLAPIVWFLSCLLPPTSCLPVVFPA